MIDIDFYKEDDIQDTEIGEIASKWKLVKLSDVAEIRSNKYINNVD